MAVTMLDRLLTMYECLQNAVVRENYGEVSKWHISIRDEIADGQVYILLIQLMQAADEWERTGNEESLRQAVAKLRR